MIISKLIFIEIAVFKVDKIKVNKHETMKGNNLQNNKPLHKSCHM